MEKEENIVQYSTEELREMCREAGPIDWETVDRLAEAQKDDPIDDFDWSKAKVVHPKPKTSVSIRMDAELIAWFKQEAAAQNIRGYQTLMHTVLESYKNGKMRG